jgi:hypothetical protein
MVEDPDSDGYVDVARPLSTQRNYTCPLKIVMSRLAVFSLVRLNSVSVRHTTSTALPLLGLLLGLQK